MSLSLDNGTKLDHSRELCYFLDALKACYKHKDRERKIIMQIKLFIWSLTEFSCKSSMRGYGRNKETCISDNIDNIFN